MARETIKVYLKSAIESGFEFIKRRFGSVEELNENFRAQRDWIFERLERKADFKRRLGKVLEVVKMHSCKYLGISFMTENVLCKAYEERFGETISKRTVGTCVKLLREIGFVSVIPAKREDGKQTANIVVIERIDTKGEREGSETAAASKGEDRFENVAHKEPENLRTVKTTSSSKTTSKEQEERMAKERRLLNFVPKWFRERIACCSAKGREVHEYWKVAKHLMSRTFGAAIETQDRRAVVSAAVREFYQSAKAASRGKFRMANPFGFFHSVLEAEAYAHVRRCAQRMSGVFYNWLES